MEMDFKLDLFNEVNNNMNEYESLFFIYYNEKTKENISGISGDMQYLVSMACDNNAPHQDLIKAYILNAAINIIQQEPAKYLKTIKDFCNNLN